KMKDQTTAQKVLEFLSNVSKGQTRLSKKQFDTSVYWGGEHSRLVQHKCYLKHDEFIKQFEFQKSLSLKNDQAAMRVVDVMSDQRLIDWTVGLMRFESRLKKRWLERNEIPTNLFELIRFQKENPELLKNLWLKATKNIFDALKGQTMRLTDDESVYKAIESSPVVLNAKGKVSNARVRNIFAMFLLVREKGIDELKKQYGKSQFYNLLKQLEAVGFSPAFLQNLHTKKAQNIIPFVKLIEIDFNQQLPDWYQTPVSQFKTLKIA
ncbi:MAG: phage/plasmid replication protein, II/X family, partial [Acinetobacter baumannii]